MEKFKTQSDVLRAALKKIEWKYQNPNTLSGIPSGFTSIDNITDGWQKGNSIIIGARPGSGKTALALQFAQHAAERGNTVGFISLEMNDDEKGIRFVAANTGIRLSDLQHGRLDENDFTLISNAMNRLASLPIIYEYNVRKLPQLAEAVINMIEKELVDMIIIDHLQLIHMAAAESRRIEVETVSNFLKETANKYRKPIITLAQLNRDASEGRPSMRNLKESGAIEQDADVIILLHRLPDVNPDYSLNVDIIFEKGRNIGQADLHFTYYGFLTKFKEKP